MSKPPSRAVVTSVAIVQLLAVGLWASGLLTLGAVVAPIVFHVVPAPSSADAMTLVFRRFDGVAITCAAIALVAEAAFALRGGRVTRADVVRGTCLVIATGLAITIGAWLSPGIAELHRGGAIRGLGDAGLALEAMHRLAESLAKGELLLLLAVFVLTVIKATRHHSGTPPAHSPSDPAV
jgi:Domain of unknown function (DUF4149)